MDCPVFLFFADKMGFKRLMNQFAQSTLGVEQNPYVYRSFNLHDVADCKAVRHENSPGDFFFLWTDPIML
jgi:hypothetical protein